MSFMHPETRTIGTLRGAPISVTVTVQERLALVYAGRSTNV